MRTSGEGVPKSRNLAMIINRSLMVAPLSKFTYESLVPLLSLATLVTSWEDAVALIVPSWRAWP